MISYNFSPLQMQRLPAQQPHGMAPLGNPLKTGLLSPNHAWMFVWSTPTIICVCSVICINFYIVLSFMIFYDFSSNTQTSLRNVSLECIIFRNFYRVIPFTIVYNFLRFFMIFYDFSSNIQTGIRNIKQPLKGVFRVYILLLLTSLLHSFTHEASSSSCIFSLVSSLDIAISFYNSFSISI